MNRVNELRDRVSAWAARQHQAEVLEGMRVFLGEGPREDARVLTSVAFALLAPPPGADSLIARYAALPGSRPRAERVLFQQWAATEFSIFRVVRVEPAAWLDLHDVLRGRTIRVHERTASGELEIGVWLAAFVFSADGRWLFEGTLAVLAPERRVGAVQAALRSYAESGVVPEAATPVETRRVARAVLAATHAGDVADVLTLDEPVSVLDGQSLQAAFAAGRQAEVWALLPEDGQGDALAAMLGMRAPG